MNPADFKHIGPGQDPSLLPLTLGYEVAGIVTALGPHTVLASGHGALGDEVVAFQIMGGYTTALNVSASDVFAKSAGLEFPHAANLLLVGTTASEMLDATVAGGDVVLLHGAAGAVGTSAWRSWSCSNP
jgi:NADPH:quinone reductase-like Zn-dependent oxidoreductase